jgi:hypothetical protein
MTRSVQGRNKWRATRAAVGVRGPRSGVRGRGPGQGTGSGVGDGVWGRGPGPGPGLESGVRGSGSGVRVLRALRRLWNNQKYATNKLRFAHTKDFPRKLFAIRACALKQFPQPCHRPKMIKRISVFGGLQIINIAGVPTYLWQALAVSERINNVHTDTQL